MKVALGVTGGIAAYKAAEIVRLLQDRGIRVQVIMTRAAQEFVRPLTFAALSGEKVITGMFSPGEEQAANIDSAIEHIAVAQSIDALAGGARHRRRSGAFRARHCQRFSHHALSRDHGSGRSGSGDEREHVESSGDAGESGNPAQARSEDRRTGLRISGLRHDRLRKTGGE